jgi:hypothetical protein
MLPWSFLEFSLKKENTHRPVTNLPAWHWNACAESFEPDDALVHYEFSVADRFNYKQASL